MVLVFMGRKNKGGQTIPYMVTLLGKAKINKNPGQIRKLREEFQGFISKIHGFYLDSTVGFELILKDIENQQGSIKNWIENTNPEVVNESSLDVFPYSHEQEFSKATYHLQNKIDGTYAASGIHRVTLGEMKRRNKPNGNNCLLLGNTCIVMLYSYWEDYFREALANAMGITKSEFKHPVWGDLGLLRNSIIHNNGIANSNITKAEVLRWYQPGDKIFINQQQFKEIIIGLSIFGSWISSQSPASIEISKPNHKIEG